MHFKSSGAPFANIHRFNNLMCNLDNYLCASEMKWPNQVICCSIQARGHGTKCFPYI